MPFTLGGGDAALRARTAHRLPLLVLACTLALLIAPAAASAACSLGVNTFTDATANHDWFTAGNWSVGVPADGQFACVPAGKSVTVAASGAKVSDLLVEGSLTVSNGDLTVTGNGLTGDSTISGSLTIQGNGTLYLANPTTTISADVNFANTGTLDVTNGGLVLTPNTDLLSSTAGNIVHINAGASMTIDSAGAAAPTQIQTLLNVDGSVSNTGDVNVAGGGNGLGDWRLGSGDPEPTVTISSAFELDGKLSDVDSGGLGHLVIADNGHLQQSPTVASTLAVYRLDIPANVPGDGIDITPGLPGATVAVNVNILVQSGANSIFDVVAPANIGNYTLQDGHANAAAGVTWNIGYFHWGGGSLESGSTATMKVATLAVYTKSGDAFNRKMAGTNLTLDVAGTDNAGPMTDGGIDLAGTNTLILEYDSRLSLGDAGGAGPDITGGGTIVNYGIIEKSNGNAASTINPTLQTTTGQLWVTGASAILRVAGPFDALNAGVLKGNFIVDGELDVNGPVTQFDGQFQLGVFGKITNAGADVTGTLTSNAAGTTITVQRNGITLAQPFTNNGTIDVQTGITLNAPAGMTLAPGGTLKGRGIVKGDVSNPGGSLAPGASPGQLTINGNYNQSGTGVLFEEINGPVAGTDYDQLIVTGTATLGGVLALSGTGYVPPNGQQFDVIQAGNVVGDFNGVIQFPTTTWFDTANTGPVYRLTANSVTIGDVTVNEGNSGTTPATFTISLGQASNAPVSVDWATQDGSAAFGSDYAAASGTVNFAAGETTKTVTVDVTGDTAIEPDENFAVNLSNPVGTRIRDAQGVGTITNDDSPQAVPSSVPPGDIDGFLIPPPPVQGKKVNVEPRSGKVLVKLPGKAAFISLPDAEQVPVGTIVDATKGKVRLYSVGKGGRVQFADFYEGVFQVSQKVGQALTVVKLLGGSFTGCPSARGAQTSAKKRKKSANTSIRHLWGDGKGQFQTQGKFASATIRGTRWLTDDRCNGTLIRVAKGAVTVRDFTLRKSLALKAPKKYLAAAAKPKAKRR